jgi:hypothetical protein
MKHKLSKIRLYYTQKEVGKKVISVTSENNILTKDKTNHTVC